MVREENSGLRRELLDVLARNKELRAREEILKKQNMVCLKSEPFRNALVCAFPYLHFVMNIFILIITQELVHQLEFMTQMGSSNSARSRRSTSIF